MILGRCFWGNGMALNSANIAVLGGVAMIGASCLASIVSQADRADAQTVTPPPEVLIDSDPIAVPPPNVPAVRRTVAPVAMPSTSSNRTTSGSTSSPSMNGFRSNQFSAANAPAPVSRSVIAPTNNSTNNYTAANTTTPNNVTINRNYRGNYQGRYGNLSNGNFNNTATTVAASDLVNPPANVPVGNPETPGEINQLFAFLSQNIPPVDGQPNELNYAVVLPATSDSLLSQIQEIVPTARVITSRRGACIQVQAYRERGRAESLTSMLRSVGFDARVLHQSGL